jgi:hypothetical protein
MPDAEHAIGCGPAASALDPFGGGRVARTRRRRRRRLAGVGVGLSALFALTVLVGVPAAMAREAAGHEVGPAGQLQDEAAGAQQGESELRPAELARDQQTLVAEVGKLLQGSAVRRGTRTQRRAVPAARPADQPSDGQGALPWLLPSGSEPTRRSNLGHVRVHDPDGPPGPTDPDDAGQPTGRLAGWEAPVEPSGWPAGTRPLLGAVIAGHAGWTGGLGTTWPIAGIHPVAASIQPGTQQQQEQHSIYFEPSPPILAEDASGPVVTANGEPVVGPDQVDSHIEVSRGQKVQVDAIPLVTSYRADWAFDGWTLVHADVSQPATSHRERSITIGEGVTAVIARYSLVSPAGTEVEGLVRALGKSNIGLEGLEVPVTFTWSDGSKMYKSDEAAPTTWTLPLYAEVQATAPQVVTVEIEPNLRRRVYRLARWYTQDMYAAVTTYDSATTISFTVQPGLIVELTYLPANGPSSRSQAGR